MLPAPGGPGKWPPALDRRLLTTLECRPVTDGMHNSLRALREIRVGAFGIGELTVGAAFILMVLAWVASVSHPPALVLRDVFMAGFIGGFTDTVAIRMLFTRYWFLPGSGVLLKERDAIIATLADTMEQHILNPTLIEGRVVQLASEIDRDKVASLINSVLDDVREDLIVFARAPEQRTRIVESLRVEGGFWGSMADALGIVTYEVVADRLTAAVAEQIRTFRVTGGLVEAAMERIGSLDSLLLQPGHPFVVKHYGTDRSLARVLFETLDARQLGVDRLSPTTPPPSATSYRRTSASIWPGYRCSGYCWGWPSRW
jgi:hypothetical protein